MSIIKTENICKSFGSVDVLKNVSLTVEPVSYTHLTLPTT